MPQPASPLADTPASWPTPEPRFRYFDLALGGFVAVLVCANLIGAGKVATVAGFTFGAGILFFPLSYVFNDVLTEVYGYARARRAVWCGFAALIFASLMCAVVVGLPAAPGWTHQGAYEVAFGQAPRIVLASLLAFCAGEFVNSYILARLKVATEGKHLWARALGSTVAGEAVDSAIFYPVAFAGLWSWPLLLTVMASNYVIKVLWEVLALPITYRVVAWLKRAEGLDHYDRDTDFTPFSLAA